MSDNYEQPVEPMSRAEDILRGNDTVHPMSRVEALLKELIEAGGGGGGSTVVVTPIQQSGTKIANITVNGVGYDIYAPEGSSGSVITIDPEYQSGTLLATLTIDGTEYYIYAPTGGGGGSNLILDAQIYSTDEKQVGVWIDGKPLYQYVAVTNGSVSLNNDTYKNIPLQYTPPNIETLISGVITRETPNVGGTLRFCANNGVIQGAAVNSYNLSADVKIIFLFTKTTDAAGSGGYQAWGFSPIIYSTEEREIGVWVDNKPLYQKTVIVTSIVSGTNTINHNISNIDRIVNTSGTFFATNNTTPIPNENSDNAWSLNMYDFGLTTFSLSIGRDWVQYFDHIQITIQYTKTTDTAGSGSYNTLGVPNVHYSTDEQVIGTWIDGKPIYQKTIQVSNKTCNSTGFEIDTGLTNVKKIIDEKITVYINQYSEEYLLPYYRESTSEEIISIKYLGSSGVPYLQVRTRGANYGACSAEATLQYTKTTD